MTSELSTEPRDHSLDAELKDLLGGQPRPSPPPFVAQQFVRRVRSEESRHLSSALAAYWIIGSALSLAAIAGTLPPAAQSWLLFLLVPLGFGLGYAWQGRAVG